MLNRINQTGGRCCVDAQISGAPSAVFSASYSSAISHPLSVLGGSAASTRHHLPSTRH
jgi:hypothetical protein